jgi:hypothetical protein
VIALVVGLPSSAHGQSKEVCARAANDGQMLRDRGEFQSARAQFVTCAREACPTIVSRSCQDWLAKLDLEIPTVVFRAIDEKGRDRTDVRVSVDDKPVAHAVNGMPIATDPGEHVVRYQADDGPPAEMRIVLRTGEKDRQVTLELPIARAPSPTAPPPSEPSSDPSRDVAVSSSPSSARTVTLLGLAGLAIVSAGLGTYFLVQSSSASHDAANDREGIPPPSGCWESTSPQCSRLGDDVHAQHRDTNAATAFFVTVGVLAAGAIVTWLLVPAAKPPTRAAWSF